MCSSVDDRQTCTGRPFRSAYSILEYEVASENDLRDTEKLRKRAETTCPCTAALNYIRSYTRIRKVVLYQQ